MRCEQGRPDDAASIVAGGLPPLVDSWLFLGIAAVAAQVRVALGDLEAARRLRDLIAPFADRMVRKFDLPVQGWRGASELRRQAEENH